MSRQIASQPLTILTRCTNVLALALLFLTASPGTSLAGRQPHLYQEIDLSVIADEAAESLGWPERVADSSYSGTIRIEHIVEMGTCQNYDSVSPNRYVEIILIRTEGSPEEAEQSASRYGSETPVSPEPFHELNGYRVSPQPTGVYFSWAMGKVRLTAGNQSTCLPDGQVLDPMPIAEALYAAAVHHGLGMELPPPVADTSTPTPAPLDAYTLQGTVTDGYNNPVRYAKVRLTFGVHEQFTVTDANGRYQFAGLPGGTVAGFDPAEDAYRVTVFLQYAPDGSTPLYQVLYGSDTGPVVAPVSRAFSLNSSARVLKYDLNFGYTSDWQVNLLENIDKDLPIQLASLAAIYVHVSQAIDLADQLDQEISHPFNVVAFTKGRSGACWYGRMSNGTQDWNHCLNLSNKQYSLGFGDGNSWYGSSDRPANREWHEFGHHFLADAFGGFMPDHAGRQNHQGYYVNTRSTDAWTEGFAEFFAMMVNRQIIGDSKFMEYKYDGAQANLETNYQTWDDEEFAAAGLLLDLVDDADDYSAAKDDDQINETVADVWTMISKGVSTEGDGNGHIFDMVDLYNNLAAWGVGSEDLDKNGRADLKDLFIAHGFFDDIDGNHQYASGDRIGYTSHLSTLSPDGKTLRPAMTDRRDKPCLPGAYIGYTATSDTGSAVTGAAFQVDVLLDPPNDYLNMSYTIPAEALHDGRLCIMLPPSGYPSHIRIAATADGYQESDPVEITGADFWSKVPNESDPPLLTHTFTLKSQNNWVGPIFLISIFGLCGLGVLGLVGLVLGRRKTSINVSERGRWANVVLIILVLGLCCVVITSGVVIWHSNPLPVPSALPTQTQLTSPSLPSVMPTISLPVSTASPSSAAVLFQDDFSDPNSGWDDVRTDEEANTYYFENNYLILINPANHYAWANPYQNFPGNVRVEIDARKASGSQYDEFGVLCRYAKNGDDTYSYYYFAISVDGLGAIYRIDHGEKGLLLTHPPKNRSDVVHPDDQVNRIRADCIGDRLTLYVNGEPLVDAVDSALRGGDVGLRADSETGSTEIHFDNFIVFKPAE